MADNISIKDATGTPKTVATGELDSDSAHASKIILVSRQGWESGVDQMSEALEVIDYAHHEIHEGDAFAAWQEATLGVGDSIEIAFTTPASPKRCHLVYKFYCADEAYFEILEGVGSLAVGSGAVAGQVNRNRAVGDTPASTSLVKGSTGSAISYTGGTSIWEHHVGSGNEGGSDRETNEWVLAPSTSYVFRVQAENGSNECWVCVDWYEHTDSN